MSTRIRGALADAYVGPRRTSKAEILQRQIQKAGPSYCTGARSGAISPPLIVTRNQFNSFVEIMSIGM
jgi:hypothetical protein